MIALLWIAVPIVVVLVAIALLTPRPRGEFAELAHYQRALKVMSKW